jgi:hypothetical protein
MKFPALTLPTFPKKKIRRRNVKRAFVIALYAFVAIVTVMGMISPAFTN